MVVTVRKVNGKVVRSRVDGDVQLESGGAGAVRRAVGDDNRVSGNKENQCRGF